ncbi:MAG: hypothetical protein AB1757_29315 [Acidobacteriota bacterium]
MKTKSISIFLAVSFILVSWTGATSTSTSGATPQIAYPDLVSSIKVIGDIKVVDGSARVPIAVVVKNQGNAPAARFKVSLDYRRPDGRIFAVMFAVPGQSDQWSPWTRTNLLAGKSVTFTGDAVFNPSTHGVRVSLWAIADSCAGDEFVEDYCRVKERNENNNKSAALTINLP